jgi:hypothetical protein
MGDNMGWDGRVPIFFYETVRFVFGWRRRIHLRSSGCHECSPEELHLAGLGPQPRLLRSSTLLTWLRSLVEGAPAIVPSGQPLLISPSRAAWGASLAAAVASPATEDEVWLSRPLRLSTRDVSRRRCACEPATPVLRKWLSGRPQGPTVLRWD